MRCFGRARLTDWDAPALLLIFFRAVDFAAALPAVDFFCVAVLAAAREVDVDVLVLVLVLRSFFLAIGALPFPFPCGKVSTIRHGRDGLTHLRRAHPDGHRQRHAQCSRNTPSTARNSAGLISLEWATVTENNGPSSFSSQKVRKSFNFGNFGKRS